MKNLQLKLKLSCEKTGTDILRRALDRIRLAESYPLKDEERAKGARPDGWFSTRRTQQTVRTKVA